MTSALDSSTLNVNGIAYVKRSELLAAQQERDEWKNAAVRAVESLRRQVAVLNDVNERLAAHALAKHGEEPQLAPAMMPGDATT